MIEEYKIISYTEYEYTMEEVNKHLKSSEYWELYGNLVVTVNSNYNRFTQTMVRMSKPVFNGPM